MVPDIYTIITTVILLSLFIVLAVVSFIGLRTSFTACFPSHAEYVDWRSDPYFRKVSRKFAVLYLAFALCIVPLRFFMSYDLQSWVAAAGYMLGVFHATAMQMASNKYSAEVRRARASTRPQQ